jgi:flagellar biosynthesis/type III secretory pathway protein FliH
VQGIKSISLEKESAVGRGGCIVKTSLGELDARVNNKIDHIFNALKDKVHERTGE